MQNPKSQQTTSAQVEVEEDEWAYANSLWKFTLYTQIYTRA